MAQSVAFVIPSLSSGGAERVVARLAEAFASDYRTFIFVRQGTHRHYEIRGVEIIELDFTADAITRAVQSFSIDIILDHYHWDADHVRMMAGLADSGLKIILTEHNSYHYPLFQWSRDKREGYDDWFDDRYQYYAKFAAVTVLNEDTRSYFSKNLRNVRTIHNPVPYPVNAVSRPRQPTVLNVSHFRKRAKRLDLLYTAFNQVVASVPESQLIVLGDYDWLQDRYLRLATNTTTTNIICPGRTKRVEQYYDQASVFALPSEIEGQPMVLLEAALHGVPQVSFDLPGMRDQIIDGETGFLVPFGDLDRFSESITMLLSDPAKAGKLGMSGREFVLEKFSVEGVVTRWKALISEIWVKGKVDNCFETPPLTLLQSGQIWEDHWNEVAHNDLGDLRPKISFLVPVYATEELLGRCLRSIQVQTLTEFECIVVDDASPGDVAAIVKKTIGDDARFRLVTHSTNRGLYQARSTAASFARGLFFSNIDSDDYIHPRFGEIMFAEAVTTGSEIVECQAVELQADGRPIRFNEISYVNPVDGPSAVDAFFNNSIRNVVWNKIYSRDLWKRTPDHNEIDVGLSICEDLLRNSLLFPNCRRYSSVKDCLYFYCRRPTSVVKGGDLRRLLAKLRDIEFSYCKAKSLQETAEKDTTWLKLEARRVEDIQWYISEFVQRSDITELRRELRSMKGEVDPALPLIISIVDAYSKLQSSYDQRVRAWLWERERANRLDLRLQEIRRVVAI